MTQILSQEKLSLKDTLKSTFMYFFCHLNIYLKLATLGAVILLFDMFADFPTICAMRGKCGDDTRQLVSALLMLIVSVSVIILYSRNIIIKDMSMRRSSFVKTVLLYFLYNTGMVLSIAAVTLLSAFMLGVVFGGTITSLGVWGFVVLAITLLFGICIAPVFLIFPALTVEDRSFTLKEVFKLAKSNRNNIFWGQIAVMLPGLAFAKILNEAYAFLGVDNYLVNELFLIILLVVSLADSCLRASYYSHLYLFFKPQQQKD